MGGNTQEAEHCIRFLGDLNRLGNCSNAHAAFQPFVREFSSQEKMMSPFLGINWLVACQPQKPKNARVWLLPKGQIELK